jgi:hypothetical protein
VGWWRSSVDTLADEVLYTAGLISLSSTTTSVSRSMTAPWVSAPPSGNLRHSNDKAATVDDGSALIAICCTINSLSHRKRNEGIDHTPLALGARFPCTG